MSAQKITESREKRNSREERSVDPFERLQEMQIFAGNPYVVDCFNVSDLNLNTGKLTLEELNGQLDEMQKMEETKEKVNQKVDKTKETEETVETEETKEKVDQKVDKTKETEATVDEENEWDKTKETKRFEQVRALEDIYGYKARAEKKLHSLRGHNDQAHGLEAQKRQHEYREKSLQ